MTNETTEATPTTEATTPSVAEAPAKAAAKKAPKKAAAKKAPAKGKGKAPAKKAAKGKTEPKAARAKKDGLRKPQVRVLKALAKASPKTLTRLEISEKGEVDLAMLNSYIGSHDPEIRATNDAKIMPSLRTLGYVKVEEDTRDNRTVVVHAITPAGRKALEKAEKGE